MDLGLKGKVAVVTGGARGIGRGIALTLVREGVRIAVNYVNRADAAEEVVRRIRESGGEAQAIQADVGVYADAERLVTEALQRFGRIDILVNNAGIVSRKPILDVPLDEWDRVVHTNLYGCFHCSRLVGRHMLTRGGGGKIISISSIHGRIAKASLGPYCATKAAIDMFSKQLAVELAPHRINVNVVASGTIITEINLPLYQSTKPEDVEKRQAVLHRVPWGEIGQPEDIGGAVAFLASDAARYITGAVLYVDGGYTAEGTPRMSSGAQVP
ncbi:MAG TPA: glucose 1-dehydrogenase [Candidatus Methylomirabilis sp.]|nr:glucose 1-dehydrogenase [Candidatus Methylomirabilis sp.]